MRSVLILLSLSIGVCLQAAFGPESGSSNPDSYRGRQLVVGSGGGITGLTDTYYLFENGNLYARSEGDSAFTRLRKQPAAIVRRLFKMVEDDCRIRSARFDNPGNVYRFVRWKRAKEEHTVTWGDPRQPAPASYTKLYRSFMTMVASAR
ncbi:hypothetical protein [Tellurirhabdus rosea]|uniref:hypothetical protein n=1 Tax=Tellurirhabdus rosea TaxID=2674997 RepID=UPI0022598C7A|nr:hypothetical protein [Tellurirhabdus rosea]